MDNHPEPQTPGAPLMRLAGVEDDRYDALADLFLGESELAPQRAPETRAPTPVREPAIEPRPVVVETPRETDEREVVHDTDPDTPSTERPLGVLPMVELLVLGHLPVRAALWVRQYACSVAKRCGERVALVRVSSGSVSVDLVNTSLRREITQDQSARRASTLLEALALASEAADRIILRVDETSEPEVIHRDEIDTLTILTGADEAAVVSSYRLIKSTTMNWEAHDEIGTPHLRLAVMGATSEQAEQASVKLTRAIDAFLDRPIEIIDAAGRIDSTATQSLYQGTIDGGGAELLDALIEANCGLSVAPTREHAMPDPEPRTQTLETPEVTPQPASVPPSRQSACDVLGGMTRLVTKCPLAPDVEIGCDDAGRLHLVCVDEHDNASLQLESARTWVRDHLDLIIRAEPKVSLPTSSRDDDAATLHLLATDPRRWRSLIDSDVRLYALASTKIGARSVRLATPLN